jgi:hypothetical protein
MIDLRSRAWLPRLTPLILCALPLLTAEAVEPFALWSPPATVNEFGSPLATSGVPCGAEAERFRVTAVQPPMWCPNRPIPRQTWRLAPAIPLVTHPDRSDVVLVSESFTDVLNETLAPLERSWRAGLMIGVAPDGHLWSSASGPVPEMSSEWFWSADNYRAMLRPSAEVVVGRLRAGSANCELSGKLGSFHFTRPCGVPLRARTGVVELYPLHDPDWPSPNWLATVDVQFLAPAQPLPKSEENGWNPLLVIWAAAATLSAPVSFWWGRRQRYSGVTNDLITPVAASEAPPELEEKPQHESPSLGHLERDPYLMHQTQMLDKIPHLRLAAHWLARDSSIISHESSLTQLMASSEDALRLAERRGVNPAYLERWRGHTQRLRERRIQLHNLRLSLAEFFDNPRSALGFAAETRSVWREVMPHTTERIRDKGLALAAQFRLDLLDLTVIPVLILAQWVFEALPKEQPEIGATFDPIDLANLVLHCTQVAEGLGYRYEHVSLYSAFDVDYVLDRDVTLVRADATELTGVRPDHVESGVVFRIDRPLLLPLRTELPKRRALFVIHRSPG